MELQQLEQLADQYGSLLYSFCLRLTGHRENGEDFKGGGTAGKD